MNGIEIVYGPASKTLATRVGCHLDKEIYEAQPILDPGGNPTSVRLPRTFMGADVFIVHTSDKRTNDGFMTTAQIAGVLRDQQARSLTLVAPSFPYSDCDSGKGGRVGVTLRYAADMLRVVGVNRVMSVDFHSRDAAELMSMRIINLRAAGLLAQFIQDEWDKEEWPVSEVISVASNFGEATDIARLSRILNIRTSVVINRPSEGESTLLTEPGESVEGRHCLIIDDTIRTGDTAAKTAELLKRHDAKSVRVVATHMTFPPIAAPRLQEAPIDKILVTDTVPDQRAAETFLGNRLSVVHIGNLLAEAIKRVHRGERLDMLW